jgi:hypothetical protein
MRNAFLDERNHSIHFFTFHILTSCISISFIHDKAVGQLIVETHIFVYHYYVLDFIMSYDEEVADSVDEQLPAGRVLPNCALHEWDIEDQTRLYNDAINGCSVPGPDLTIDDIIQGVGMGGLRGLQTATETPNPKLNDLNMNTSYQEDRSDGVAYSGPLNHILITTNTASHTTPSTPRPYATNDAIMRFPNSSSQGHTFELDLSSNIVLMGAFHTLSEMMGLPVKGSRSINTLRSRNIQPLGP